MATKEVQYYVLSQLIFFGLSLYISTVFYQFTTQSSVERNGWSFRDFIKGLIVTVIAGFGLIFFDISRRKPSNSISHRDIVLNYALKKFFDFKGRMFYKKFIQNSLDPMSAQRKRLLQFVDERKTTVFGKDHDFESMKSVEDFRSVLPLTSYDYYKPYAERIAKGEKNVMLKEPVEYIVLTSGTTGGNKKIPLSKKVAWNLFMDVGIPNYPLSLKLPARNHLRKPFMLQVLTKCIQSEGGLKMGPFSSYFGANEFMSITPTTAINEISDEQTLIYIECIFGLRCKDIEIVIFNFVSLGRSFLKTLENKWESVCNDIETGTITADVELCPELRRKLEARLKPCVERATELRKEFRRGFHNILPRIWPELCEVQLLCSGTLAWPSVCLKEKYFPGVPVYSLLHMASEGGYGACFEEPGAIDSVMFTMLPHSTFYEFIPLEEISHEQPSTKLMHELELGKEYEMVVTTDRGLCRYRTGDLIKVVSYFNKIPKYDFIGRYGQPLNLITERTSENAFHAGLEETLSELENYRLVDYTATENWYLDSTIDSPNERFYVLFIALECKKEDADDPGLLTQEQKDKFDKSLQLFSEAYRDFREVCRIQQMKVVQTNADAFDHVKQAILAANPRTSSVQFKMPRVLRNERLVKLMCEHALD